MGCLSAMLSSKFIQRMLSWDNTISYNPQQNGDNAISYNPQQNGVTEKKNQLMVETTNWMLKHVNLPNNLWQKMACDFPLCNSLQCLCTYTKWKTYQSYGNSKRKYCNSYNDEPKAYRSFNQKINDVLISRCSPSWGTKT